MECALRKLAAILVADVEGYAQLMGKDEEGTLGGLERRRPTGVKRSLHILCRTRCSAITLLLCFGSFFFFFISLSAPYALAQVTSAPQVERRVTLLAINDVYRIGGVERGRRGGLPRVRTLRRELEVKDRDLIVLHAGDVIYPSLLSRTYDGEQMIDVLNTLDGDPFAFDHRLFVTFGNHEFDKRKFDEANILSSRVRESQFYWLRSNITFATDAQGLPVVRGENLIDARIIQANGVKVGLFGLTTNIALADYVPRFTDPKEAARRLTQKLRSEGAEVIIAVTHLTLDEDKDILASLGPAGPDLIIGGHEHTQQHEDVGGRWVLKADADAVSALVVTVVPLHGEAPAVKYEYKELEGDGPIPDPDVNRVVQRWHTQHQDLFCARDLKKPGCLDEEIGRTAVRLIASEEKIRSCETNLGNWIADQARLAFEEADAAFINAGSLRLNQDLAVGAIYRRDLEELVQYDSKLHMIEIDPTTLTQVVNNAVSGWPGNGRWLQISGFTFSHSHISRGKDKANGLALLGQDGQRVEFRPGDRLRVITTDFLLDPKMGDQDGYSMLNQKQIVSEAPIDKSLKSVIRDALSRAPVEGIAPKVEGRIAPTSQPPCVNDPPSADQTAGEKKHSSSVSVGSTQLPADALAARPSATPSSAVAARSTPWSSATGETRENESGEADKAKGAGQW